MNSSSVSLKDSNASLFCILSLFFTGFHSFLILHVQKCKTVKAAESCQSISLKMVNFTFQCKV